MDNDSGDRSSQVQDGENNDSGEQSPFHVSQERHKNEEKDSLANRKQESPSRVKKKRKRVENGKFLLVEKIQILHQLTLLHQQKRKRKANVSGIINRHRHLPQLPAIQVPMRNRIMAGFKLSLKMKNLNGNYPKVWPTTQTNTFEEYVPEDSFI